MKVKLGNIIENSITNGDILRIILYFQNIFQSNLIQKRHVCMWVTVYLSISHVASESAHHGMYMQILNARLIIETTT